MTALVAASLSVLVVIDVALVVLCALAWYADATQDKIDRQRILALRAVLTAMTLLMAYGTVARVLEG